ncbi:MAG: 5-(carboxyamino)imidazole ribonucleotide synthase [Longimicrobiales bacterium]
MKVGILGGGQLGRMLALEGIPLGGEFRFLEPAEDPPAAPTGRVIQAAYDDPEALDAFAGGADVVTYEFENVPVDSARRLGERVQVLPPPAALQMAQDRLVEKKGFEALGIPTPDFHPIDGVTHVDSALAAVGLPAVLKTRRFGYDGKGQSVVNTEVEARQFVEASEGPLIAEAFVSFDRELSIIAVAGQNGDQLFYPITENHHSGGILRVSYAPAEAVAPALQRKAEDIAGALIEHLGYVGVLAVELFQVGQELMANEIAPRVHNSGHWTLDGAQVSQFENHIRAVTGLPLGDVSALGPSAMVNLIGTLPDTAAVVAVPGARLHLYGKSPRPGRKLGHVNVLGDDWTQVLDRVAQLQAAMPQGVSLPAPLGGR